MDREARKEEIRKAIDLVGWLEVRIRIITGDDQAILEEISKEWDLGQYELEVQQKLKDAGITF